MKAQIWISLAWTDANLHWDPAAFDQIQTLNVFPHEVYLPDITLYNSANLGQMNRDLVKTRVIVYASGQVLWVPPAVVTVNCQAANITKWPNDEHECKFIFGSWTHSMDLIDVNFKGLMGGKIKIKLIFYFNFNFNFILRCI